MNFYNRVKKYLFLLASLISLVLVIHIVVVYLYDGSEEVPEKGGSFSIGFVESLPNLDPTLFGMNTRKDFVLSLLYRGLLQYNPDAKTMEGDLATCDLGRNLTEIRCSLKDGNLWSDGSKITIEDALATYSLLAETDKNKRLQNGLAKFAITREGTSLVFRNSTANTENIEFLTLPIIKKSVAEQMRTGEKNIDPVYSGEYIFDKKEANQTHANESLHLVKSSYTHRAIYDRLILRFYEDEEGLNKDLGSVNIIYPDTFTSNLSNNRFTFKSYTTPDFTSTFINTSKFGIESRKVLSKIIANSSEESIKNPFGVETPAIAGTGAITDEMLEKIGFFRKNKIPKSKNDAQKKVEIKKIENNSGSVIPSTVLPVTASTPAITTSATTPASPTLAPNLTPKKVVEVNPELRFFDTPGNTKKTAVVYTDEIQIGGKVPKNIDSVTINGYELKGFQAGESRFVYRARTSIGNLRLGKNTYELRMYSKGKIQNSEILELYTVRNQSAKEELLLSWEPSKEEEVTKPSTTTGSLSSSTGSTLSTQIKEQSSSGISITPGTGELNVSSGGTLSGATLGGASLTGITVVSGPSQITPSTEQNPVIDNKLYTANGARAKITIHFIPSTKTIDEDVDKLKNAFEEIGFEVQLTSISPEPESILEAKKVSSKTYDLFVVSVNLGFIGVNLTPYFHSGQVQDGFNFSGIKNPSLDPLLEEVSTKELSYDQKSKVLKKISEILRQEFVCVPLRLHTASIGIDMLVRDFNLPPLLPESKHLKSALLNSYIKTIFIVDFDKKSFQGFLDWSQKKLFQS